MECLPWCVYIPLSVLLYMLVDFQLLMVVVGCCSGEAELIEWWMVLTTTSVTPRDLVVA